MLSGNDLHPHGTTVGIERTSGDPDQEWTVCTQLHTLEMMMSMTVNKYMARFKMLVGRTRFNKVELEDMFI